MPTSSWRTTLTLVLAIGFVVLVYYTMRPVSKDQTTPTSEVKTNPEVTNQVKKKDKQNTESPMANVIAARSALLDFYGDRAVSFASLFVASVFGIVTILAIAQGIALNGFLRPYFVFFFSLIPYVSFAFAGRYAFRRFVFYADIAGKLAEVSLTESTKLKEIKFEEKGKEEILGNYLEARNSEQKQSWLRFILHRAFTPLYWIIILLLGISVYFPLFFS